MSPLGPAVDTQQAIEDKGTAPDGEVSSKVDSLDGWYAAVE